MIYSTKDWERRLLKGEMPVDLKRIQKALNQERAEKAATIFGMLRIPDVAGQPTNAEATGEWFFEIVRMLAGGLQEDGTQKIQNALICVPKKNGKSSSSAGLMLTLMLMSPRPNAEFVILGPTQGIANIAFRQAQGIVNADPELREVFHVRDHLKQIVHRETGCVLKIQSFDDKIVTGTKASVVLIDECHLLGSDDASRIVGQLRGAAAAIRESQVIGITTMSDRPASGWWKAEIAKARAIRDGQSQVEAYLPVIYEPPKRFTGKLVDACQPELLSMMNPNLGRSVDMDWLKKNLAAAIEQGEAETRRFLSQHANLEIGSHAGTDEAWTGAAVWLSVADPELTLDEVLACPMVAMGFDGGGFDDLTSVAAIGVTEDDEWLIWTHSWVWPVALERRKSIAGLLTDFANDGDLTIAEPGQDIRDIVRLAERVRDVSELIGIGVDPNGLAHELGSALVDADFKPDDIVQVRQGFALKPGWTALDRRLRQAKLRHCSQDILDWAVSNSRQDPLSGLVTKKLSGAGKIDPIVSVAVAAMVAQEAPTRQTTRSYLEDHPLMVLSIG